MSSCLTLNPHGSRWPLVVYRTVVQRHGVVVRGSPSLQMNLRNQDGTPRDEHKAILCPPGSSTRVISRKGIDSCLIVILDRSWLLQPFTNRRRAGSGIQLSSKGKVQASANRPAVFRQAYHSCIDLKCGEDVETEVGDKRTVVMTIVPPSIDHLEFQVCRCTLPHPHFSRSCLTLSHIFSPFY